MSQSELSRVVQFLQVNITFFLRRVLHLIFDTHAISMADLIVTVILLTDTDSLVHGLKGCCRIKAFKIEGNPVHEDPDCR